MLSVNARGRSVKDKEIGGWQLPSMVYRKKVIGLLMSFREGGVVRYRRLMYKSPRSEKAPINEL
jgi:hypothetical protein